MEARSFLEVEKRFRRLPLASQHAADQIIRRCVVGIDAQRDTQLAFGARRVAPSPQELSRSSVCSERIQIEGNRFLHLLDGRSGASQNQVYSGRLKPGNGARRPNRDHALQRFLRADQFSGRFQNQGEGQ